MSYAATIGFRIEALWISLALSCVGPGPSPRPSEFVEHRNLIRIPDPGVPVVGAVWPEASTPRITVCDGVCRLIRHDVGIDVAMDTPKCYDSRVAARAAEATAWKSDT